MTHGDKAGISIEEFLQIYKKKKSYEMDQHNR
jgi:hypothetical protein